MVFRSHVEKEMVERKRDIIDYLECDVCHEKYDIRKVDGDEMSMSWPSNSSYDEVETGVFIKGTTAYPEDGYSVTHFVHVCPDCFRTKLITLLEANGIKFNKVDRDW